MNEVIKLDVEQNCINQEEIFYENHKRGKNWIASINRDVTCPSNMNRIFWKNTNKSFREIPKDTYEGQFLEIGADYYTAKGKKLFRRKYYIIHNITETIIELLELNRTPTKEDFNYETIP